jgi:hypothetical protein
MGLLHTETRTTSVLPRAGARTPPLAGATTPIPPDVVGADRLIQMGAAAVCQAVDEELATKKIALLVCAPTEADEPELAGRAGEFLGRLASESQIELAPRWSRMFASGRDAIFEALPFARNAVGEPEVAAVCVLGVDSLVTKPRLRRYLERGGNAGAGTPSFGEAAAAVLLTRLPRPGALASLVGLGLASQAAVAAGKRAKGLLTAVDLAIREAQLAQPTFAGLVHDMAGSAQEAEDLAWAKTSTVFMASPHIQTAFPYVAAGDAGAAMGTLAVATAAFLVDNQAWPGMAMCCLSSPARRGGALLAPLATKPTARQ